MAKYVIIDSRFGQYSREVQTAVEKALRDAAVIAAREAQSANLKGYHIEKIVGAVNAGNPHKSSRGHLENFVVWTDFRATFFEKGTRSRRRGKLKSRTKTGGGPGGVKAIRFASRGRKAAQLALIPLIKRHMP